MWAVTDQSYTAPSSPQCLQAAAQQRSLRIDFKVSYIGLEGRAVQLGSSLTSLVWRKVLKDLITYFRDIQKSYETRSKSLYTLSNVISNITTPPQFVTHGGISDAINVLRDYHKQSIAEGNKAKSIEEDVISQLTGLRSDLGQKIKEIKGLSGDFKNNVDKETEGTRRAVRGLQDALESSSTDPKSDPYLVRLGVDRQVGKQIEEENYLHRVRLRFSMCVFGQCL